MGQESTPIRTRAILETDKEQSPVTVCEHISLPDAYPEDYDSCEYAVPLSIYCEVCGETYEYTIKVN